MNSVIRMRDGCGRSKKKTVENSSYPRKQSIDYFAGRVVFFLCTVRYRFAHTCPSTGLFFLRPLDGERSIYLNSDGFFLCPRIGIGTFTVSTFRGIF